MKEIIPTCAICDKILTNIRESIFEKILIGYCPEHGKMEFYI